MCYFGFLCYICVTNVLQKMKRAEAEIYIDGSRPKKNGRCSVKIKITFLRKRKYFNTGIDLTPIEFEQVLHGKRKSASQKETFDLLTAMLTKAKTVINELPIFSFPAFEMAFLETRNVYESVSFAFDKYIEQLNNEGRIGTANSYRDASNSLQSFRKGLSFAEITPAFLKNYESWMLKNNKSITTVGIYLRSLRAIYNLQGIDASLYPFGAGKSKYSIPASNNIKKALTMDEISLIYNFSAPERSNLDRAKDYWLFLYLCNGMNVKDLCLLKWQDIEGNMLKYNRAKTKRTKKNAKLIQVSLKTEALEIIYKWGQPSINKDSYIFPHLQAGMSPEIERTIVKQLTKTINKYIRQIALKVGINKHITTYFARHSFATILKRENVSISFISEALGHSSMQVTESYLDSLPSELIHKETDVLTRGLKKAN